MFLKTLETEDLNDLDALGCVGEDFSTISGLDSPDFEALEKIQLKCKGARTRPCLEDLVSLVANARRARVNEEDLTALGGLPHFSKFGPISKA